MASKAHVAKENGSGMRPLDDQQGTDYLQTYSKGTTQKDRDTGRQDLRKQVHNERNDSKGNEETETSQEFDMPSPKPSHNSYPVDRKYQLGNDHSHSKEHNNIQGSQYYDANERPYGERTQNRSRNDGNRQHYNDHSHIKEGEKKALQDSPLGDRSQRERSQPHYRNHGDPRHENDHGHFEEGEGAWDVQDHHQKEWSYGRHSQTCNQAGRIQSHRNNQSPQRWAIRSNTDGQREPQSHPKNPRNHTDDTSLHPPEKFHDTDAESCTLLERARSTAAKHLSFTTRSNAESYETTAQYQSVKTRCHNCPILVGDLEQANRKLRIMEQRLKDESDKLDKAQKAALALADRFQPKVDEEIQKEYNTVDGRVFSVCKSLHNLIPEQQEPDQWPREVFWEPFIRPIKFSDKTSRRKVLISVVWKFLVDYIFNERFSCFGGEISQKDIGPSGIIETEESARWRATTAEYLMHSSPPGSVSTGTQSNLQEKLITILVDHLGYGNIDKSRVPISNMLRDAESFKRILMRQRAAFEIFVPHPQRDEKTKGKDDKCLVNNVEEEGKTAGKISFVMKPGLRKRGTGRGTDFDDPENTRVIVRAFVQLE
ncbi:hypothetical protein BGZ60DRAFT_517945 [Tricladium varicosporioides]|nr:hypothetical protein BGZ60DRAFT_517945 [Hymenoscyphus varicosporioides]